MIASKCLPLQPLRISSTATYLRDSYTSTGVRSRRAFAPTMTGKIKILVNIIFPVTGPTNSLFPVKPRNAITFALPVPAEWQFTNVWELAEERYRKNYAVGQNE